MVHIFSNYLSKYVFINRRIIKFKYSQYWSILEVLKNEGKIDHIRDVIPLRQALQCQLEEDYPNLKFKWFGTTDDVENFDPKSFDDIKNFLLNEYEYRNEEMNDILDFLQIKEERERKIKLI